MYLIGSLREPPSRVEAEAFLARFVATGPGRLAWFLDEVGAVTGLRPEPTLPEVGRVVAAVVPQLRIDGGTVPGRPPEWLTDRVRSETLWTDRGAALADGFVHFVAELYRRELGATWVLSTDPLHAHYHQPVMSVRLATPPQRFLTMLFRIETGKDPADRVVASLRTILDAARAELAAGPPDDAVGIGVEAMDGRTGFTHQVWLDENAETALGRGAFDSLVRRFAGLPGVEDVLHEDREVFLLRAPGVPVAELESAVRAIVADLRP